MAGRDKFGLSALAGHSFAAVVHADGGQDGDEMDATYGLSKGRYR